MQCNFRRLTGVLLVLALSPFLAGAEDGETRLDEQRAAYRAKFDEQYPSRGVVEAHRAGVTGAAYDEMMLGEKLDARLENVTNEKSGMAWGLSYDHLSLNQMARATGDTKYLAAAWRVARAVADAQDSARGLKLTTGESGAIWGCSQYADGARVAHAVHTGVIAFPVLETLLQLRDAPDFDGKPSAEEQGEVLDAMRAALAFHDRQWRNGPGEHEGHYVGANQEKSLEGVALPANRLSAMGGALWLAYRLTGDTACRDKALRIGWYLKNRISRATDKDAYVWAYSLMPEDKAMEQPLAVLWEAGLRGEDISHGSLTAVFPMLLHRDGEVFDRRDAERFANTVTGLIGPDGGGMLYTNVDGMPRDTVSPGLLALPGRWLRVAPDDPEVYAAIEAFLLTRAAALHPLDLANLIRYRPGGNGQ